MWKVVASHLNGEYVEMGIAKTLEEAKQLREIYRVTYGDDWDVLYYRIEKPKK